MDIPVKHWVRLIKEIKESTYSDVLSLLSDEEIENGIDIDRNQELLNEVYDKEVTVSQRHKDFSNQVNKYYNHPIWLINGIWHESSNIAINDRLCPVELICENKPKRTLDLGGGIGTVARLISLKLPFVNIDIVDISELKKFTKQYLKEYKNISILKEPSGPYPAIISTEVLEHCIDPIKEVIRINRLLKRDGIFVATWCFTNVCKCHIVKNFYMKDIFDKLTIQLGFKFVKRKGRGYKFIKTRDVNLLNIVIAYSSSTFYRFKANLIKIRMIITLRERLRGLIRMMR